MSSVACRGAPQKACSHPHPTGIVGSKLTHIVHLKDETRRHFYRTVGGTALLHAAPRRATPRRVTPRQATLRGAARSDEACLKPLSKCLHRLLLQQRAASRGHERNQDPQRSPRVSCPRAHETTGPRAHVPRTTVHERFLARRGATIQVAGSVLQNRLCLKVCFQQNDAIAIFNYISSSHF